MDKEGTRHMHALLLKYYPAVKKNEKLPFVTTWTDLEGIMLSEINRRKTKPYDATYRWNLRSKINEQTKQRRNRFIDTEEN